MITYFTLLAQLIASGDYYVPKSAGELLRGLYKLDDESRRCDDYSLRVRG